MVQLSFILFECDGNLLQYIAEVDSFFFNVDVIASLDNEIIHKTTFAIHLLFFQNLKFFGIISVNFVILIFIVRFVAYIQSLIWTSRAHCLLYTFLMYSFE